VLLCELVHDPSGDAGPAAPRSHLGHRLPSGLHALEVSPITPPRGSAISHGQVRQRISMASPHESADMSTGRSSRPDWHLRQPPSRSSSLASVVVAGTACRVVTRSVGGRRES
jgi:hypothetical protein